MKLRIKKDKTPRVLIIYMNAWITRKYNDKHLSIFEYDVYTAIQEAFQDSENNFHESASFKSKINKKFK